RRSPSPQPDATERAPSPRDKIQPYRLIFASRAHEVTLSLLSPTRQSLWVGLGVPRSAASWHELARSGRQSTELSRPGGPDHERISPLHPVPEEAARLFVRGDLLRRLRLLRPDPGL